VPSTREPHPDEVMTATEASRLLGVDQTTLKRWVKAGRITHFRTAGGHMRFRRRDVDAFIAARLTLGQPAKAPGTAVSRPTAERKK
jgi:excisionase family DNA binding protein